MLARPEFKAMFLDDLLNGSRKQMSAPFADVLLFSRHWGFEAGDVQVPVRWWHGDADHIIPLARADGIVAVAAGQRVVARAAVEVVVRIVAGQDVGKGASDNGLETLDRIGADGRTGCRAGC